jgi:hypothetical protein
MSEQQPLAKAIEQFEITKPHEQKKAHGPAATVNVIRARPAAIPDGFARHMPTGRGRSSKRLHLRRHRHAV